jgi:hypothetical protein
MRVTVQGLMNGQDAVHITAPENEKTLLTIDAAKAMKEIPKTTDSNSLKPPLISSLFIIKTTPQSAIATMEIHLPAGPVMVFTTCSRGLENSVMPPDADAISGNIKKQRAERLRKISLPLRCVGSMCMTISIEAVMRRLVGARGPQNMTGMATGTHKLDLSGFHVPSCQQSVAVAATNVAFPIHTVLTV